MYRTMPIVRREFREAVGTKMFLITTLFGPLFILAILFLPVLLAGDGPEERKITIVDEGDAGLGAQIAATLAPQGDALAAEGQTRFIVDVRSAIGEDAAALEAELEQGVEAQRIEGFLWLPEGIVAGDAEARYEGKGATSASLRSQLRAAIQQSVQQRRLASAGIAGDQVAAAMKPVPIQMRRAGKAGEDSNAGATMILAISMGYATFLMVMLYGMAVMRGAMEEKRDKIVEVVISSIRARDLLVGKVIGIGASGMLQVAVWVLFAALALTYGDSIAERFGATLPELPKVPLAVGIAFFAFFTGGFLLYAAMYATVGSIATTDQEAQQLNIPIMMPLMIGFFLSFRLMDSPDGSVAVISSMVPFTSPIVMPMRMALIEVPVVEVLLSLTILIGSAAAILWAASKIYRIGMLSSGQRPSMAEMVRWVRTA